MGLDICCKCGKVDFRAGSYSGFDIWRKKLAELCGLDLEEFWVKVGDIDIRNGKEPFFELLNHSDCDGTLPYRECKRLLEDFDWLKKELHRPKRVKDVWKKIFKPVDIPDWWMERFDLWHEAIRHAVNQKCKLIFY